MAILHLLLIHCIHHLINHSLGRNKASCIIRYLCLCVKVLVCYLSVSVVVAWSCLTTYLFPAERTGKGSGS